MNKEVTIKTLDGKAYDVPIEGSLGLLALGYVGVMLWREKIREQRQTSKNLPEKEQS